MESRGLENIIIGIDPGSRCTGYGIIASCRGQDRLVAQGFIRCEEPILSQRLHAIYQQLNALITQYTPHEAAIEQVFTCKNPQSAIKLGQARGAALTVLALHTLPVSEYAARTIKKSVVGYGAADKKQIQHMVKLSLGITTAIQADAADALAIALCHAHHQPLVQHETVFIRAGCRT